jgi:hypothetical protein
VSLVEKENGKRKRKEEELQDGTVMYNKQGPIENFVSVGR